jgi:hypothetical protein
VGFPGLSELALIAPFLPFVTGLLLFLPFGYLLLTIDRGRTNSPSKDDTQAGIKLVLWSLALLGVITAAMGAIILLGGILSGFKNTSAGSVFKTTLPLVIVGVVVLLVVTLAFLPRTNNALMPQAERYAMGYLGFVFGLGLLVAFTALLEGVFNDAPWSANSFSMAATIVTGAISGVSIARFGGRSGWTTPVAPPQAMPPAQYPPQGGGYPPQGGGYPPQGGGYPPQGGGGYPPQGGGGYPPQGGGYPPQGGGGGGGYGR